MEDDFHRISVAALRNRELVTTTGGGPSWAAAITKEGREYLARADGENPPLPRQENLSVSEKLVRDILAAGGRLRFPRRNWHEQAGVDYERRARIAERLGRLPPGTWLRVEIVGEEVELAIEKRPAALEDAPRELLPVVVAERIGRYHPAARAFRESTESHQVSRESLKRATRIIHAIAVEAERRRWRVEPSAASSSDLIGRFCLGKGDLRLELRLCENGVHPRGAWEKEVRRHRGRPYRSLLYPEREAPTGRYDQAATGRLVLEILTDRYGIFAGRQSRFGDGRRQRLEDRLPHLFREIEARVVEVGHAAERHRIATERRVEQERRRAEERERQWGAHMERARARLLEERRETALEREADAWHRSERLRRYLDAAEATYGDHPDTRAWLTWARGYVRRLDPLRTPPKAPESLEETPALLQPYLPEGFSAHGPNPGTPPAFGR